MPATLNHPSFKPPEHPLVKIWRYMDFTKYVHLLSSQSLYFSRSDRFDDPFEGSYSKHNVEIRPKIYEGKIPENRLLQMSKVYENMRIWTYINCWHINEYESAAMWKLYAKSNEAIAIQSNYKRLCDLLPEYVFIGRVEYIDYENDWLPEGNTFYPFMHKRKSFEHEKELRAIIQDFPIVNDVVDPKAKNEILGKMVNVPLDKLLDQVYVAPTADEWFFHVVKGVTEKYGCNIGVTKSKLDDKPVY